MAENVWQQRALALWIRSEPRAQPARERALRLIRSNEPISAIVLTKNSAARLDDVLTALRWCDEIVVFDTGSTDHTVSIAERHANVCVHRLHGSFPGFGAARRQAVALARHDWILSVDSDEIVSPTLAEEIAALPLDAHTAYSMPFHNYYRGRRITTCGWDPDRHVRLFNRTVTNFSDGSVHEHVETAQTRVHRLREAIIHHPYGAADDFLRKMRVYGALFAERNAGRRSSGPAKAVFHGAWAFFKSYILRRGVLQGMDGLIISVSSAQGVFWKYVMLYEANRQRR